MLILGRKELCIKQTNIVKHVHCYPFTLSHFLSFCLSLSIYSSLSVCFSLRYLPFCLSPSLSLCYIHVCPFHSISVYLSVIIHLFVFASVFVCFWMVSCISLYLYLSLSRSLCMSLFFSNTVILVLLYVLLVEEWIGCTLNSVFWGEACCFGSAFSLQNRGLKSFFWRDSVSLRPKQPLRNVLRFMCVCCYPPSPQWFQADGEHNSRVPF